MAVAAAHPRPSSASRRIYPRIRGGRPGEFGTRTVSEGFGSTPRDFLDRTAPTQEETKEHVFDKSAADPFRHDAHYATGHLSIAPPESKLELKLKDRRGYAIPPSLKPQLEVLERPLRCMARGAAAEGSAMSIDAARLPPQPVPQVTQRQETEFVDNIEKSLTEGQTSQELWDQYAKRAEELLITMSLEKVLRVLKAFVTAKYRRPEIYTHIGTELAKEVKSASSTRLCQTLHWIARAGLRDPTLMTLIGNETLLRLSDDFVLDMYLEVLNVHGRLDIRNTRLIGSILRELQPLWSEFSRDQVAAVAPLTVMNVLSDEARRAYLSRCAELGLGLPVRMTKPSVLRQFRLLEDCLRFDYHPTTLPNVVQLWLTNLKSEADEQDVIEPVPLSPVEQDILKILTEEMDFEVEPIVQDGVFTLHLVMGKTVIEVLNAMDDYYVTPAMGGQRLLQADTKLRQKLLWRKGWRIVQLQEQDWLKLTDDLYKKDMLEELLEDARKHHKRMP